MFAQLFGKYLTEQSIIKEEIYREILEKQKAVRVRLGTIAVAEGLLSEEQAEEINAEVNVATMELAYATSIAVENGTTNGELKRAKEAYASAKKKLDNFNQKQINKIV